MFDLSKYADAMSSGYWQRWNDEVQARIDRDIDQNRKADGAFQLEGAAGAEVRAEQLSSSFVFGAHIFNFNQLGSDDANEKYQALYGTLFNSATIAFYWRQLELEEGRPRFRGEYRDTAQFWNNCPDPMHQPHWRRPATDPVVEFCRSKGIRLHGHTLVWSSYRWQIPEWLIAKIPLDALMKGNFRRHPQNGQMETNAASGCFGDMDAEQFADAYPEYTTEINTLMARRIIEIAMRYGDKIDSWDVVNESAMDYANGRLIPGARLCKSLNGPMPGDYACRGFKIAQSVFPSRAKLNINDFYLTDDYLRQVQDLRRRGCKIDIMGAQMHLFDPKSCLDIADGISDVQSPKAVTETFAMLGQAGVPIHLSEITITAPSNDERGQAIQAVITRNLYRLWFSLKPMMGITWWNVVDGCGAPGEPGVSGLFSKDMRPKPAYFALDDLINRQWRTSLCVKADKDGVAAFRGFRGTYRLTWHDPSGQECTKNVVLE